MNGDKQMSASGGSSGSLIGSIIVVIILIVGAIYLFSQKAAAPASPTGGTEAPAENTAPVVTPEAPVTQESLDAEANLAATDTKNLDQDLGDLGAGL